MRKILIMSIIWIIYGVLGLFGWLQKVPAKYKGSSFEKEYKRFSGIGWLLLGFFFLLAYVLSLAFSFTTFQMLIILCVCSLPSIVFSILGDKKFGRLLDS